MVAPGALPPEALLRRYGDDGSYVDCFFVDLPFAVTQARFVEAFYTAWLFRVERWILAALVRKPSSDAQARAVARGEIAHFAAWTVEARAADQLLMCDFRGDTRSWFMTAPVDGGTRLYFGSAVMARAIGTRAYRLLIGFHKLYSRALLATCAGRLHAAATRPAI